MPTFAALASCEESLPSDLDGQNVLPFLTHPESGQQRKPIYVKAGSGAMLRQGDFKLVVLQDGTVELFNLGADPLEQSNLAEAESAQTESLMKLMEQMKSLDSGPAYWDQQGGER
jgi:arylsulfatase A-like enzyme